MNSKAEKFQAHLKEFDLAWFNVEVFEDELETAIFHGELDLEPTKVPVWVMLDNSLFSMIRVAIHAGRVPSTRRAGLESLLGELNNAFKCFKHYVHDVPGEQAVILDISVPGLAEHFDPALILHLIVDHALPHVSQVHGLVREQLVSRKSTRKTTRKTAKKK